MPQSSRPTLLVIPAFRESQRLPSFLPELCEAVAGMEGDSLAVRVVDDGSGAEEQEVVTGLVASLREDHPFLMEPLLLEKNLGKGGAVYAGWDAAEGDGFNTLGFVDADGAVCASEVVRLAAMLDAGETRQCLYAARIRDGEHAVKRTLIRKWLGLIFRRLTRLFFKLPIHDSQCGFKFVPAQAYYAISDQLTENRYCFDIDLTIHLLKTGLRIEEIPISWHETSGTKVTLSQGMKMLKSLWQLRKKVG